MFLIFIIIIRRRFRRNKQLSEDSLRRHQIRELNYHQMIHESVLACIENTCMDRRIFFILCQHLRTIRGLKRTKNMDVEEMVAIFLHIISHDVKNRIMRRQFARSGETVRRKFNVVLNGLLRLYEVLLKKPEPISDDSTDSMWKWFKNCLRALDGMYIKVNVLASDRPRYQTRKNEIATNVLGVVSQDMQFIYVLPRWEGSAADSRVLRDAISRPNGLKVPKGCYYLCDARYPNGESVLTPYRGQRYHFSDWTLPPNTPQEFFNIKHSSAMNIVDRAFGLLKGRWAILRGRSYYLVKIQCRIILACCLLHNLIRSEMTLDPLEHTTLKDNDIDIEDEDCYTHIETSNAWTTWKDNFARENFELWQGNRHA
ncbi:hypothetical protein UlMin_004689 [Ulmus minor]